MLRAIGFYFAGWNESIKSEIPGTAVDTLHSGDSSYTQKLL